MGMARRKKPWLWEVARAERGTCVYYSTMANQLEQSLKRR
jgi:hypothetical protein